MKRIDVSIYLACKMTGLTGKQIWDRLLKRMPIYEKYGIKVTSPVFGEGIPYTDELLPDRSDSDGLLIWKKKDKAQIRDCNVCVFDEFGQGAIREYCLSRGVLWKASVFVGKGGFIARAEDDAVCGSDEEAALTIVAKWGTKSKRRWWRLKMLNRCLPKWIWDQIREFK